MISDLSFRVNRGQALLLTGPNGAGKTTLIRALAGLLPWVGGAVELYELAGDDRFCERCHYVAHTNAAKMDLTVRENLRFWVRFLNGDDSAEVAAIAAVGLTALANIPVRYLSAGQQRRVAVARLLVAKRTVWLLDEPTVSLDAANTARLVAFGNAHLASGGIIVAATHTPLGFEPTTELQLEPVDMTEWPGDIWDAPQPEAGA